MRDSRGGLVRLLPLLVVAASSAAAVSWTAMVAVPDMELPRGFLGDFDHNVWDAGRTVLTGRSPVRDDADVPIGGSPYLPIAPILTMPFAVLPYGVGAALWTIASIAALVGGLALCGVRDWRCHALALASPPVIFCLAYGNVSVLLVAPLAAIWVWRGRGHRAGVVLGLVVAMKLFVIPLLLWLVFTGRTRAAVAAGATAAVASLVGWAVVGFDGLLDYPTVLRRNTEQYAEGGDSLVAVLANVGMSVNVATVVVLAGGVLLGALAWRRRTDDLMCFATALVLATVVSPLVWTHYYALMLVPLALSAPRLTWAWLLPYLTAPQLTAATSPGGNVLDAGSGVAFLALTLAHVARAPRRWLRGRAGGLEQPAS